MALQEVNIECHPSQNSCEFLQFFCLIFLLLNGLLSVFPVDQQTLRETGERILGDACERLEELV
jgi:hypothetical protein